MRHRLLLAILIAIHQLPAVVYANRQEWALAVRHLSFAASVRPDLNLDLARVKKIRNAIREDDVQKTALRAVDNSATSRIPADVALASIAYLKEPAILLNNNAAMHRLFERSYTGLPDSQMAEEHRQRGGRTGRAASALMTDRRTKIFPVLTYANI